MLNRLKTKALKLVIRSRCRLGTYHLIFWGRGGAWGLWGKRGTGRGREGKNMSSNFDFFPCLLIAFERTKAFTLIGYFFFRAKLGPEFS